MPDRILLNVRYKEIGKMLSESEGYIKNLSEQVCKALYMEFYTGEDKAKKERIIKNYQEKSWIEINGIIKDYVREKHHLELDEKRAKKKNKKMIEQMIRPLEERIGREADKLEREKMEKERERLQELKSEGKPLRPLFTDLLEVDEKDENYDEEEYDRRKRFERNKKKIDGDFSFYYRGIKDKIMEMPQYLKEDLKYIILLMLSSMEKEECRINIKIFSKWEEDFDLLRFPQVASKDDGKYIDGQIKKIKEALQEETGFPIKFKSYVDDKEKCLCLQKTNIKIQLALLFYPEFRKRFLKGKKRKRYNFRELSGMVESISKIQPEEDDVKGVEWETDNILFPYLIEYLTGLNLCIEYTKYYAAIEEKSENKTQVRKYLDKIFGYLCDMPNVFSRIQIMKDFMDSVLLFDREITEQLVIIGNLTRELGDYFKDVSKEVTAMVKNAVTDEKLKALYSCGLKRECCGIEYVKNISGAKGKNGYTFVKIYKNSPRNSAIYEELQNIYIQKFK